MNYDQLKTASEDPRVPKELVVEGLIEKLDAMENPQQPRPTLDVRCASWCSLFAIVFWVSFV